MLGAESRSCDAFFTSKFCIHFGTLWNWLGKSKTGADADVPMGFSFIWYNYNA